MPLGFLIIELCLKELTNQAKRKERNVTVSERRCPQKAARR